MGRFAHTPRTPILSEPIDEAQWATFPRTIAVCERFDAFATSRPYRKALLPDAATTGVDVPRVLAHATE